MPSVGLVLLGLWTQHSLSPPASAQLYVYYDWSKQPELARFVTSRLVLGTTAGNPYFEEVEAEEESSQTVGFQRSDRRD